MQYFRGVSKAEVAEPAARLDGEKSFCSIFMFN